MRTSRAITGGVLASLLAALAAEAQSPPLTPEQMKVIIGAAAEGAKTYAAVCESCHGPPNPNTPPRTALLAIGPDHIYAALTSGKMKMAGDTLTDSQKRAVSIYLTGKPLSPAPAEPASPPPAPDMPAAQ